MEGWIKLHRDVLDSRYFQNEAELRVWVWLNLTASTKTRFVPLTVGKGKITIGLKRGQIIYGRNKTAEALGINPDTLRKMLERMAGNNDILIESTHQYSIITLLHYNEEQSNTNIDGTEYEQPITNLVPSEYQPNTNQIPSSYQADTNRVPQYKNVNKGENLESKESISKESDSGFSEENPVLLFSEEEAPKIEKESPPSPPRPPTEKKEPTLYTKFIDVYFIWHKEKFGFKPKMDATQGASAKKIISYLKEIAKDESPGQLDQHYESETINAWQHILNDWKKLEPYFQTKTQLNALYSEIQQIITQIKNGTAKQQITNNKQESGLTDAMQILYEREKLRNSQSGGS